jgi:hypothetical protein
MAPNDLTRARKVSRWIERVGLSRWSAVILLLNLVLVFFFSPALPFPRPEFPANIFVRVLFTVVMVPWLCLFYCAAGIQVTRGTWQPQRLRPVWLEWLGRMVSLEYWLFAPAPVYIPVAIAWPAVRSSPIALAMFGLMIIGLTPLIIAAAVMLVMLPVVALRSAMQRGKQKRYRHP